ncbi:MAG TPA: integrase [Gallionella sp.]|nr:integrase [Gallionella sp.]
MNLHVQRLHLILVLWKKSEICIIIIMGKPRKIRKDLPQRVYFKHGAYYFVNTENKWIPLGKEYGIAMQKWAAMLQPVIGKQRLSSVMDTYIKEELPSRKPLTQTDYLTSLALLRPIFGEMFPEDIEPKDIYAFMRMRNAPVRSNRDVAVLSNVMNQAIKMGLINTNPCKQVRRNVENPRTREVLDSEIVAFLPHCPEWLQAYIRLKLLTGLRQGDMLSIRLDQLRDDGLFVQTGKRGKKLLFSWSDNLRTIVETIKALRHRVTSLHLINSDRDGTKLSPSGFKSTWARAMKRAIEAGSLTETFAENDLRAKVATEARELGQNATKILGHSSDAVTKRHYERGTSKVEPLRKKY